MILDPFDPPPSETPQLCALCKGAKVVATAEGDHPCISCAPAQKCPVCASDVWKSGACGMCGHIITLKENGI